MSRTKKGLAAASVAALMMTAISAPAFATIHPIVESLDCANEQAFAHHPYGDPAEVPGQNPLVANHSEQSSFRALSVANEHAASTLVGGSNEHKLNGECGTPQGPR